MQGVMVALARDVCRIPPSKVEHLYRTEQTRPLHCECHLRQLNSFLATGNINHEVLGPASHAEHTHDQVGLVYVLMLFCICCVVVILVCSFWGLLHLFFCKAKRSGLWSSVSAMLPGGSNCIHATTTPSPSGGQTWSTYKFDLKQTTVRWGPRLHKAVLAQGGGGGQW